MLVIVMPLPCLTAHSLKYRILAGASVLAISASLASAQSPQGGTVVAGQASISQNAAQSVIQQSSNRATIDWQSFDVGKDHSVIFNQPGRSSATLNRVNSATPSLIEGAIRAPGTVAIQNTAGVIFSGTAKIDVGSLVATSQLVDSDYFQSTGNFRIGGGEAAGARVLNAGDITIGDLGLAALVGSNVENSGVIVAKRGTVALASGERTTIDLAGDGVVKIAVDGTPAGGRVIQSGMIDVGGGRVVLSAGGASGALDSVINTSGVIRASSSTGQGGRIQLVGRGGGKVRVGGRLEAKGATQGGRIEVTGDVLDLESTAALEAVGLYGGGEILVGGGYQGGGDLRHARVASLQYGATLTADGGAGAGGTVVVWSDEATRFDGRISATGATSGGLAETSSKGELGVGDQAEVTLGEGGSWLLDPRDIRISNRFNNSPVVPLPPSLVPYTVSVSAIESALQSGADVLVATNPADTISPGTGAITTDANTNIEWNTAASLTFDAVGSIDLNGTISSAQGDFIGIAGGDITVDNTIASGSGDISLTALGTSCDCGGDIDIHATVGTAAGGDVTLDAAGSVTLSNSSGRVAQLLAFNIGDAGTLSVTAGDAITLETGTQIDAENGGDLVLQARTQTWDGLVRSGSGAANGGNVRLTGDITASVQPVFNLGPDKSFELGIPSAVPSSSYSSFLPLLVSTEGENGLINIAGDVSASTVSLLAPDGSVEIGSGGSTITASGSGNAVVIATGNTFTNHNPDPEDAIRLTGPYARWLIYIDGFDDLIGTAPGPRQYDLYGRDYWNDPPSELANNPGNRIIYREQPTLTITGLDETKTYGDDLTGALRYTMSGFREGDSAATALYGLPTATSAGAPATAGVGDYAVEVSANASEQGYLLNLVDGALTVTPAALTITADDLSKTYGDALAFAGTEFTATGLRNADTVTGVDLASAGAAATASVAGSPYAVTAANAAGTGLGNYTISYAEGALTVTPAALTITADDLSKTYGAPNPPFTASYSGFVNGEDETSLDGTLSFFTPATALSPVGPYDITAFGLTSVNYAITYNGGTLTVVPGGGGGELPGQPGQPDLGALTAASAGLTTSFDRFSRGLAPFTPGDATYRTTELDAPLAASDPFGLTYSLGAFVQTGGAPAADSQGFVPAAGGLDSGTEDTNCAGPINLGYGTLDCTPAPESYWAER